MRLTTPFRAVFRWLRRKWLLTLGILMAAALLLTRLAALPSAGQLSLPEFTLASSGGSWRYILHNPFFLPYRAVAWLSRQILVDHPTLALRLPSVLFGLLALLCTIYVTRRWYGPRTAFFGFILLATSAALLHVGRLAAVDVMYFAAIPLLLTAHIGLLENPGRRSLYVWLFISVMLVYIPGLVWFVLLQLLWQRKLLVEAFAEVNDIAWRFLTVLLPSVALIPLLYGFLKHLNLAYALTWLGLPTQLPTYMHVAKNAAASISFIVFRTPADPARWLSTLPLLSAFMLVCLIAGALFYITHIRAERTRLLISLYAISFLLLAAGGIVSRSLLVPLLYIVAFGGIAYLLHFWLGMFPKNVTARWLGIAVVCIAVALTVTFNLRHYFIAWPHNQATRIAFRLKTPAP